MVYRDAEGDIILTGQHYSWHIVQELYYRARPHQRELSPEEIKKQTKLWGIRGDILPAYHCTVTSDLTDLLDAFGMTEQDIIPWLNEDEAPP